MNYDKKNYRSCCDAHLDTEVRKIVEAIAYDALLTSVWIPNCHILTFDPNNYEKFADLLDLSDDMMAPVIKHLGLDQQPIAELE